MPTKPRIYTTAPVDHDWLAQDLSQSQPPSTNSLSRQPLAESARFHVRPDRSSDGRKHDTKTQKALPYDGAADFDHHLADDLVQECVDLLKVGFWGAMRQHKDGATETSNYSVKLLDYLVNRKLKTELTTEVELAAQWMKTLGWCALATTWKTEIGTRDFPLSLEQIATLAASGAGPAGVAQAFLTALLDPTLEAQAVELAQQIYQFIARQALDPLTSKRVNDPELAVLGRKAARDMVRELREKGETVVALPVVQNDGLQIRALKPYRDLFLRDTAEDIQKTPVHLRLQYDEVEFRSQARVLGWNAAWVEAVLAHAGESLSPLSTQAGAMPSTLAAERSQTAEATQPLPDDQVEVYLTYRRLLNDRDQPVVWATLWHPKVKEDAQAQPLAGLDQAADFGHGLLPFVVVRNEKVDRAICCSRGEPEIVLDHQNKLRALENGAVDWTEARTWPPINEYRDSLGGTLKFGRGVVNEVKKDREPHFMEMPPGGFEVAGAMIEHLKKDADQYRGRQCEHVHPIRSQTRMQSMTLDFLSSWVSALRQGLHLCQLHMPDSEFSLATGAPPGWLEALRTAPPKLEAELDFDVRELDPEYVQGMLKTLYTQIVPGDVGGILNRNRMTGLGIRSINARWAGELIQSETEASDKLYQDVETQVMRMFQGNEGRYVANDPAAKPKLQYLQQIIAANPNYQAALKMGLQQAAKPSKAGTPQQPESPPARFARLVQKYGQSLQFAATQQDNKTVGAIGVKPEGMENPM